MVCICSSYLGLPNKLSQDAVSPTAITNFAHKSSIWAGLGGVAHLCSMGVSGGLTRVGRPSFTVTHSLGWHIGACWGFHLKALPPFPMVLLSFLWGCLGFHTAWWLGGHSSVPRTRNESYRSLKSWAQKLAQHHFIILLFKQSLSLPRCKWRCHRLYLSVRSFKDYLTYYSARHSVVLYGKISL